MLKSRMKRLCPNFVLKWYGAFKSSRIYRVVKYRKLIDQTHEHYSVVVERIKNRGNRPLRFASYVVYDSTFGAYGMMDLMLAEPKKYSPRIVICPDVVRGDQQMREQYKKTKDFFVKKYGAEYVVDGYDEETETFVDVSDQFDVIYCANPYDTMVNKVHGVQYLSTRNVLPVYIGYAFESVNWGAKHITPSLEISLFWKVFAETSYTLKEYEKYELIGGRNVVLSGYAKMDGFSKITPKIRDRKRIIIAPHHTVGNHALPLSNFITYYKLIVKLPTLFPEIDFVFRPHPLLFTVLINNGIWTKDQVDRYLENIKKAGIEYSVGGDYFELFANSDAIIHDCGSFITEWLYTEKPCCFVYRNNDTSKLLSELGKVAMEYYTIAYSEKDIISFVQSVNDGSVPQKKYDWSKFRENVKINYPYVSKKILQEITISNGNE